MGLFMQEHDIYIGSVLDELNLRFAPTTGKGNEHNGGIQEMAALQKEFELFKKGRPFKTSLTALHLFAKNTSVKNRWYALVGNLSKHKSNWLGLDGDAAIVDAITKNLASKKPLPIYFASHDMRGDKGTGCGRRRYAFSAGAYPARIPAILAIVGCVTVAMPMTSCSGSAGRRPRRWRSSGCSDGFWTRNSSWNCHRTRR